MSEDSSTSSKSPSRRYHHSAYMQRAIAALCGTVAVFFTAQAIGGMVIGSVAAILHGSGDASAYWIEHSITAQFVYMFLTYGLIIFGVAVMLQLFRWQWSAIGLKVPKVWHVLVGVLAVVPYYIFYVVLAVILSMLLPSLDLTQKQEIGFSSAHGLLSLTVTFIGLAVVAPFVEEVIMRGFLYTGLRQWLPKIIAALAVSALFGVAHLAGGGAAGPLWIGAIDTFVLSLVLVSLREITGNLWAGIMLHAVKNAVAFMALFIFTGR